MGASAARSAVQRGDQHRGHRAHPHRVGADRRRDSRRRPGASLRSRPAVTVRCGAPASGTAPPARAAPATGPRASSGSVREGRDLARVYSLRSPALGKLALEQQVPHVLEGAGRGQVGRRVLAVVVEAFAARGRRRARCRRRSHPCSPRGAAGSVVIVVIGGPSSVSWFCRHPETSASSTILSMLMSNQYDAGMSRTERSLNAQRGSGTPRREAPDPLRVRESGADPSGPAAAGSRTSRYNRERRRARSPTRSRPGAPEERSRDHGRLRRSPLLDPAGHLAYRGWDVTRAAIDARYEQVAAWLWGTTFGPARPLDRRPDGLRVARRVQAALPATATLPDRLRVERGRAAARAIRCATTGAWRAVAARAGTLLATLVEALPPADPRGARRSVRFARGHDSGPGSRRSNRATGACVRSTARSSCSPTTSWRRRRSRCASPRPTWADPYLRRPHRPGERPGPAPRRCVGIRPRAAPRRRGAARADEAVGRALRDDQRRARVRASLSTRVPIRGSPCARRGRSGAGRRGTSGAPRPRCSRSSRATRVRFPTSTSRSVCSPRPTSMVDGAGEAIFADRPRRGLDRTRARGVPAPAALPVRAAYTGPQPDGTSDCRLALRSTAGQLARRCWRRWSRKSTST